ncbi:MAG: hypothetical protein VYE15_02215 [Myxococcota bacterium]|nr:hypothetical protein [Myxococcota bacterium]
MEGVLMVPDGVVRGALLIAPGLHYLGPYDARMERLAAILASAGILTLSPAIPDYLSLVLRPGAPQDFHRAFELLEGHPALPSGSRPGVMSISFGSWLALSLASSPAYADRLSGVMIYGGFGDWRSTMRFSLEGAQDQPHSRGHDPLNRPVVYMNLIHSFPGAPADPEPLLAAWRRYVEGTWGQEAMKRDGRHEEVAQRIAPDLPEQLRPLFLEGCGVGAVSSEGILAALEASGPREWLDPRPGLKHIRCPVTLVHGVDDDVIPHEQMQHLADALPSNIPVELFLTGLLGHSGRTGLSALATTLPAAVREVRNLWGMLGALTRTAGLS